MQINGAITNGCHLIKQLTVNKRTPRVRLPRCRQKSPAIKNGANQMSKSVLGAILNRSQLRESACKVAQNIPCSVGATIIDDNDLVGNAAQRQFDVKMLNCRPDTIFLILGRNHDRKE